MVRVLTTKIVLSVFAAASMTVSAHAQIKVNSTIHSSSGSCMQCDLSNKRMNGMKLKNANFAGSSFNNSNLSGGRLDGSDLTDTHFRKALMYRIAGRNVNMSRAILQDATLTEANLSDSIMTGTDFRRADLTRGTFTGNDFSKTSLIGVTAPDVNFENSNFANARFDNVNLHKAKLDGAKFNGVKFGNAILLDATITGADFSDADMSTVQGLKQEQLNTACGNMNTRLPFGLSMPYCEGSLRAEAGQDYDKMDPEMAKAARRLERALKDVEIIMEATPRSNRPLRRKLESIHADIANSKRVIER